jgi:hypothetical protein
MKAHKFTTMTANELCEIEGGGCLIPIIYAVEKFLVNRFIWTTVQKSYEFKKTIEMQNDPNIISM